jgi:glycosyltransferase involved in cell wall biosynthesis
MQAKVMGKVVSISVVIPTFNSSQYIEETLESVFAQSYSDIEIVIVDDGSTDNTIEVVSRILKGSKKKWQVLSLEKNAGPSAARNVGYLAATGSWIQFLDSDDLLMPGKIELELKVATDAPQDVVAVISPWNWGFPENGGIRWLGPVNRPFTSCSHPVMCLAEGRPLVGSSLIRRSALNEVGGFDKELRFWECEELNVRLAAKGRFVAVDSQSPQYFWRLRPEELYVGGPGSRYSSKEVALGWIALVVKASGNHYLQDLGLSDEEKRLLLNESTLWGRMLYSQYRPAFNDYLRMARKLDPQIAPAYPRHITALSRWVGYETAEGIAKLTRQPKVWMHFALRRLGLRRADMLTALR